MSPQVQKDTSPKQPLAADSKGQYEVHNGRFVAAAAPYSRSLLPLSPFQQFLLTAKFDSQGRESAANANLPEVWIFPKRMALHMRLSRNDEGRVKLNSALKHRIV